MEKVTGEFSLFSTSSNPFKTRYVLKSSSYRIGDEFGPRPKPKCLPVYQAIDLGHQFFREPNAQVVLISHGSPNPSRVMNVASEYMQPNCTGENDASTRHIRNYDGERLEFRPTFD